MARILVLGFCAALSLPAAEPADDIRQNLQKGLLEQEVNANPAAAEVYYSNAIKSFDAVRKMAGTALLRLAETKLSLGKTNEAGMLFERVAREFSDIPELVKSAGTPSNKSSRVPSLTNEELEMERLKTLLVKTPDAIFTGSPNEQPEFFKYVASGNTNVIAYLLANGGSVSLRNSSGETPLHKAAESGQKQMAEYLLKMGADVNALDNGKATPMHFAIGKNRLLVVQTLLQNGADPNAFASYFQNFGSAVSALGLAQNFNFFPIRDELLKHPKIDCTLPMRGSASALEIAIIQFSAELLKLFLETKPDIRKPIPQNERGETYLHFAVKRINLEATQILLEHGADPNQTNYYGSTPMDLAFDGFGENPSDLAPDEKRAAIREVLQQKGGRYRARLMGLFYYESRPNRGLPGVPIPGQTLNDIQHYGFQMNRGSFWLQDDVSLLEFLFINAAERHENLGTSSYNFQTGTHIPFRFQISRLNPDHSETTIIILAEDLINGTNCPTFRLQWGDRVSKFVLPYLSPQDDLLLAGQIRSLNDCLRKTILLKKGDEVKNINLDFISKDSLTTPPYQYSFLGDGEFLNFPQVRDPRDKFRTIIVRQISPFTGVRRELQLSSKDVRPDSIYGKLMLRDGDEVEIIE